MGLSWVQVGVKLASQSMREGSQGRFGWGPDLQDRVLINFRSQHGAKLPRAKLGPRWPQNRIHKGMLFRSSFGTGCWNLLGLILYTFWDPKWSLIVIKRVRNCKI